LLNNSIVSECGPPTPCILDECLNEYTQAQGLGQVGEQYDDWVRHRKALIMALVHGILGKRTKTHVVMIFVDYHPTQNPHFQVGMHGCTCVQDGTMSHVLC
jgi:hypothetical protein